MNKESKPKDAFLFDDSNKELIAEAIESSMVGVCVFDKDGMFVYHNKAHEEITGDTTEILQNKKIQDLRVYEEDGLSTTIMVLEQKEEVLHVETLVPNGKKILVKSYPWFDEEGEIRYVISNIIDVTQMVALKEEIEKEKKKLQYQFEKIREMYERSFEASTIVYQSKKMKKIVEQIGMMKNSKATVLIQGESGTGKEMIAKLIHQQSLRKNKQFVKINCSAIPEALLESELFGYEAGSFTGGDAKGKKGLLENANHGTVLLDEIGDMPLSLQPKILRVLQEKEIQKIGRAEPIPVDIRFIAATNQELEQMVEKGLFRKDLYYRLNVVPIMIPPLRERKADIPSLVHYFIKKINKENELNRKISNDGLNQLLKLPYNGNIRELQNIVERAVLFASKDIIDAEEIRQIQYTHERTDEVCQLELEDKTLDEMVGEFEKMVLRKYKEEYGSVRKMGEQLGVDPTTVARKLRKYAIK